MRTFILGFVVAIILIGAVAFCYIRFGFVDPRTVGSAKVQVGIGAVSL